MNYIIFLFVFLICLFIYLHIMYQLKTSNDLAIIQLENPTINELNDECDSRQPIFFNLNEDKIKPILNLNYLTQNYKDNFLNTYDFEKNSYEQQKIDDIQEYLLNNEKKIIAIKNETNLEDTGIKEIINNNDEFIKPPISCSSKYDLIIGKKDTSTPLEFLHSFRNFLYVTQGSIKITLIPPEYSSHLERNNDYINEQYTSPINVWDVQEEYKNKYSRVKYMDITLTEGDIIYIPAYWWYSIKCIKTSSICKMQYYTYMNYVSILPVKIMEQLYKYKYSKNFKSI